MATFSTKRAFNLIRYKLIALNIPNGKEISLFEILFQIFVICDVDLYYNKLCRPPVFYLLEMIDLFI